MPREHFAKSPNRRLTRVLASGGFGYVLGTLPSGEIISRVATGRTVDLRSEGSGNPGGVNAMRVLGRRLGKAVLAADIAKGFVACIAGRALAGGTGGHVAGVAAVAGHCYPIAKAFRGGKGVATSFGQCLATFPVYAPVDVVLAMGIARLPVKRPALVSVAASSTAWVLASILWWRRRLPNLWGPPPTFTLPLANAATTLIIASRAVPHVRRGEPDELALPR